MIYLVLLHLYMRKVKKMWALCAAEEYQQRLYVTTYVHNLNEI